MVARASLAFALYLLSFSLLVVAAGCADEGITYVAGPFAIPTQDAGADVGPVTASDAGEEPCPTGYACMNPAAGLAAMGLQGTVTDADGNPVGNTCAKGGQEPCDLLDPAKSCPLLPKPFCAHIKVGGGLALEFDQCAQKCAP